MNPDNLPKLLLTFTLLLSLGVLAGCGGTRYGTARITSMPAGAEVVNLRDDTHLGITPLMVTWEEENSLPQTAFLIFLAAAAGTGTVATHLFRFGEA